MSVQEIYLKYIKPYIIEEQGKQYVLASDINKNKLNESERKTIVDLIIKYNIKTILYTEEKIREEKLKAIIKQLIYKDSNGYSYILQSELEKLKLRGIDKRIIKNVINNLKLTIMDEITKNERPKLVRNFEYGNITDVKINPADKPRYATIIYNQYGEAEQVDFSELITFLDEVFIPENIHIKVRLKDKYGPEYYSIQLNKIVKLQLSELEIKFVFDYLKEQDIIVCGTSEYPEEYFENYDHFNRIKKIKTPDNISNEETIELFKEMKECKDVNEITRIRNKIVVGNLRLAKWVLHKMSRYYDELDSEYETYAYEGLIKAVEEFNVDMGFNFSSFAVAVIRNFVRGVLAKQYNIATNTFSNFYRAKKIVEKYYGRKYVYGDKEMLNEILELLENTGCITDKEYYFEKLIGPYTESIEDMTDIIYSEDDIEKSIVISDIRKDIDESLSTLTETESKVLILRNGLEGGRPRTLEEVGNILGVTRERIRQIESKALRKLRHPSRSRKLNGAIDEIKKHNADIYNYGRIEKNPSNTDYDEYMDSENLPMEGVDPLDILTELYNEERKTKK